MGPSRAHPTAIPALLLASACNASGLGVSLSPEVGTVASAHWNDDGQRTRVEVSGPDGPRIATDWQDSSAEGHEATLIGLYPSESWTARVVTEGGTAFDSVGFATAPLPSTFPRLTVAGSPGWKGWFTSSLVGPRGYVFVADERGRVAWYREVTGEGNVYRARVRPGGQGIRWAHSRPPDSEIDPVLRTASWTGEAATGQAVPDYTHDFVEFTDGSIAMLLGDTRTIDGIEVPVTGNRLDLVAADGSARTLLDTFELWDPLVDGRVPDSGDWTHANALVYDADRRSFAVGFRYMDAIVEVDEDSGERLRQIGGPGATYSVVDGELMESQHQFQWVEGGLLVFDNHSAEAGSRALEWALDDATGEARARWTSSYDPPLWCWALGDVHRDDGGGTLVTWSSAGVIQDVSPEGEPRWQLSTELGTIFGFTEVSEELPGIERLD